MARSDQFYFENLISGSEICREAAQYLHTCLSGFDPARVEAMIKAMHEIEHRGDEKRHEMSAALAKAFVTPFDREDLAEISHCLDEVTDAIEEVLQRFYVDDVQSILPEALEFSENIVSASQMLIEMFRELHSFKKPQKLHDIIIELGHLEEKCDRLYLYALRRTREHTDDVLTVLFWREVYDKLEKCADACEHVADCVETIVMKNT